MPVSILEFANGQTDYVARLNANFANTKTAVEALQALAAAAAADSLNPGNYLSGMFGASGVTLIGHDSYLTEADGADEISVGPGYAWSAALLTVVSTAVTTNLSFTGQPADTYYVHIDSSGIPNRDTTSANAIYSVVWTGSAFGAITRTAKVFWDVDDMQDSLVSAVLGDTFLTLDERLEAAEQFSQDIYDEVYAARGIEPTLNDRLDAIETSLSGAGTGDVDGPASSTDGHIVQFDGTTGKLLKDGLALDIDGTLAANSDTRIASQKAVKTAIAQAIADLVGTAPGVLDTLGEISDAINDDANLYTTLTTSIALKAPLASPALTGTPTAPTATPGTNSTQIATTAYADAAVAAVSSGGTETTTTMGTLTHGATSKSTPVDADELPLADSAASFVWKKLTWANLKAGVWSAWGALIAAGTGKTTPVDADTIALSDSAASDATKKLTWANIKATLKTYFDTLYAPLSQPQDFYGFYPGIPTASAKVLRVPIARAITFAANFSGAYFTATANATGTTVFDVQKNGSSIGSVSIASGGTTATFTTSGGTSKSFAAGDVLAIIAPASADATLADPAFVLPATR